MVDASNAMGAPRAGQEGPASKPSSNPHGRRLIMFTRAYPFGAGEPFITAEMSALVEAFDEVTVVPTASDVPLAQRRPLPSGVSLLPPDGSSASSAAARFLFRHPIRTFKEITASFRGNGFTRNAITELRFRLRTESRADEIVEALRPAAQPGTVLYAYWLHLPAAVAIRVRDRLGVKIPIVSRAHRFDIYGADVDGFLPQRHEIIDAVDRIYTVSAAGAEHLQEVSPKSAAKVDVARLGTPHLSTSTSPDRKLHLVRSCSRIVPFKRLPLLIEGIAAAQARGVPVKWEHIGPVDDDYSQAVVTQAQNTLESGSFTFVGRLSNDEVRTWHATNPASVFLNVSESEGVPVSILESLAAGLPVIATDVGGNAETIDVESGMFGGLLPADTSAKLIADRIEELFLVDDADYAAYASASLKHWEQKWSSEKNFQAFAGALAEIATPVVVDPSFRTTDERGRG